MDGGVFPPGTGQCPVRRREPPGSGLIDNCPASRHERWVQQFFPYAETTRGVTVRVAPSYLEDQSDPATRQFVWSYHIRIENGGTETVQLISRHWIITDARGRVQEVKGLGVVGDQPTLAPGESFDYVSGCPLATPSGTMQGSYQMVAEAGWPFEVTIPLFSLDSPHARTRLN